MKYNDNPTVEDAWMVEVDLFGFDEEDFRTADCAKLADELDLFRIQALADDNFYDTMYEWDCYIVEHSLWLTLEQCCNAAMLGCYCPWVNASCASKPALRKCGADSVTSLAIALPTSSTTLH